MAAFQNRSSLQKYIKAITHPRTAEEWTLAITNPQSPVYKQVMIVMSEYEREELWLEAFVERLVERSLREERAEEQAIKDEIAYKEYKEGMARAEADRTQPDIEKDALAEQQAELQVDIADLIETQVTLQEAIKQINEQLETVSTDWVDSQKDQAKTFVETWLNDLPVDPDVLQRRQDAVEKAFQMASPVRILEVNPLLLQRMEGQEQPERSLAEDLMNRFCFVRELNVMAHALLDDVENAFDPAHFLKSLRENKPKPVPGCTGKDKEMICDAITGVCRRRVAEESLHDVQSELSDKRKLLTKVEEEMAAQNQRPRARY